MEIANSADQICNLKRIPLIQPSQSSLNLAFHIQSPKWLTPKHRKSWIRHPSHYFSRRRTVPVLYQQELRRKLRFSHSRHPSQSFWCQIFIVFKYPSYVKLGYLLKRAAGGIFSSLLEILKLLKKISILQRI